jgi:L-alanine-DL-glutamate epimerase-like enolase superfamily enzyme
MSDTSAIKPPDRPRLSVRQESFPLERSFVIARGAKRVAEVVVVELNEGTKRGRGECVPYARYGETVDSVIQEIEAVAPAIETGMMTRRSLQRALPAGAARNALDLALWDFDAKRTQSSAWQMAGLDVPHRVTTAFTISLDTPDAMAAAAVEEVHRPLLKLKLGKDDPVACVEAVHAAAPRARLIVDANEAWDIDQLVSYLPAFKAAGVELIEQPLPADEDAVLATIKRQVPICADESCHTVEDLERLLGLYDAVNIKLDKAGGLTAALELSLAAREAGLGIMVGCMVASSLGLAPAVLLAQDADWVDLDAPLLLTRDHQPGLRYDGSTLYPPNVGLWG